MMAGMTVDKTVDCWESPWAVDSVGMKDWRSAASSDYLSVEAMERAMVAQKVDQRALH